MSRIFFALTAFIISFECLQAQAPDKFIPSVVSLYPSSILADSLSAKELTVFVKDENITDEFRKGYIRPGLPVNWKTIRERELIFIEKQDFYSLLQLTITRELTFHEMENRVNLLIYPSKDKSVLDLVSSKKIADQYNVSWVLSIAKVETSVQQDVRKLTVTVQLYNVITHRIYLTQTFTQSSNTLPEGLECDSSWSCLIEAIKTPIGTAAFDKIEKNIRHFR